MKKFTVYFLLVALLAASLSGCGNDSIGNDTSMLPDAAPTESPIISPNTTPNTTPNNTPNTSPDTNQEDIPTADDGIVKDRDGIIEDNDNGKVNPSASPELNVNK